MPDLTPIFGIPRPLATGEGADLPTAMEDQNNRIEAILAAGIRSSGKSIVAVEQSTNSGTYTELGTPDRVEDIVVPADGLLFVHYRALAKAAIGADAKAAIFIGSNQLKGQGIPAPVVHEVAVNDDEYQWLVTGPGGGLVYSAGNGAASDGVTTGLLAAGVFAIEVAAGTYDISMRFKSSGSASVTAKDRRLRAWSMAFGMPPP